MIIDFSQFPDTAMNSASEPVSAASLQPPSRCPAMATAATTAGHGTVVRKRLTGISKLNSSQVLIASSVS